MSEYQYYEFQAVDRPLTQEQMGELRAYSSRAQITPSSFVNVYNWGAPVMACAATPPEGSRPDARPRRQRPQP